MTTLDDLIAVKALIDTPDKWFRTNRLCKGSLIGASSQVSNNEHKRYIAMYEALVSEIPREFEGSLLAWEHWRETLHIDVMDLIDRAIAAREVRDEGARAS